MRSLLFVPADQPRKLHKSATIDADALIFDLEDAVAPARKSIARQILADYLSTRTTTQRSSRLFIRINPLDTAENRADLDLVATLNPDGIVLPKARSAACITTLIDLLAARQEKKVSILAITGETAAGVLAMAHFSPPPSQLIALSWGPEDLAAELGAHHHHDNAPLRPPYELARTLTLLAAHAGGIMPIDTVEVDFRDQKRLQQRAQQAAHDGFVGKMAIHPDQVPIINQAFTPTQQQCQQAQAVIDAFHHNPDQGVVAIDGKMYDRPHWLHCRKILDRAEAYGMTTNTIQVDDQP